MEGAASIASESFPSVEAGTSPRCLSSVAHTLWVQGSEGEERALGAGLLWAAVSGEEGRRGEEKASLTPCASPPGSSKSAGRRRLSAPHAPSLCCWLQLSSGCWCCSCLFRSCRAVGAAGMTDVLPQPDCSLKAVCEPLERCCLDQLEEPGSKRLPNTGARLWGRVRSKLLRQKVLAGDWRGKKGKD